jgi:Mn2+/Fe2+ NRAMP family transporter
LSRAEATSDEPPPLAAAPMPAFPGWRAALGPGIVWMALAQGSGELIWWPYLMAKYGLGLLVLLIPSHLIQYPLTYEIGRYTILTGESIWTGFRRLSRRFCLLLWLLMTVSFLWLGGFATAGATALASLTDFPRGWSPRGQTLLWAYLTLAVLFFALAVSRVVYRFIETFMWCVAGLTLLGLALACSHPRVLDSLPSFLAGLVVPGSLARPWDPSDAERLLTAITFAGLGGFWTLFYSYWLKEKGSGMARAQGHLTGLTTRGEEVKTFGHVPADTPADAVEVRRWTRFLAVDAGIGNAGNLLTTLMTCLLAYALLFPEGVVPREWEIAVVQSAFFEASWGALGRWAFLVVAGAFLADTWLSTVDAVSRVHAEMVQEHFPAARRRSYRHWYFVFLLALTAVTCLTMPLAQPGQLILLTAVVAFVGTVLFTFAILALNHVVLPRHLPPAARPGRLSRAALALTACAYLGLMVVYLALKLAG